MAPHDGQPFGVAEESGKQPQWSSGAWRNEQAAGYCNMKPIPFGQVGAGPAGQVGLCGMVPGEGTGAEGAREMNFINYRTDPFPLSTDPFPFPDPFLDPFLYRCYYEE